MGLFYSIHASGLNGFTGSLSFVVSAKSKDAAMDLATNFLEDQNLDPLNYKISEPFRIYKNQWGNGILCVNAEELDWESQFFEACRRRLGCSWDDLCGDDGALHDLEQEFPDDPHGAVTYWKDKYGLEEV